MSLDSRWWARLAPLALRARARVDGAFAGRHRGRSSGVSGDFVGHRAYTPSDDWRHVDWTVYARTDRWIEWAVTRAKLPVDHPQMLSLRAV
ncbi:MAG TPA: DUF58 domain-containing protein, partial [Elusimicrobiota bacterium]|nr:DUF58 domain-containing protein [Elusimicrobiota bacterium]